MKTVSSGYYDPDRGYWYDGKWYDSDYGYWYNGKWYWYDYDYNRPSRPSYSKEYEVDWSDDTFYYNGKVQMPSATVTIGRPHHRAGCQADLRRRQVGWPAPRPRVGPVPLQPLRYHRHQFLLRDRRAGERRLRHRERQYLLLRQRPQGHRLADHQRQPLLLPRQWGSGGRLGQGRPRRLVLLQRRQDADRLD